MTTLPTKKAKQGQVDRISYSRGRKMSDGNYGSEDVHVSYSTDREEGETPGQCLKRAEKFVERVLARKVAELA